MPNRVLRDWTDSKRMSKLSAHAERFFTRLIMKADDFGRYKANPKILKATLLPYEADELTDAQVQGWLDECIQVGVLITYTVDDEVYLQIVKYGQKLRNTKMKYPPPLNADESTNCVQVADNHGTDCRQIADNDGTTCLLKRNEENRNETEEEKKSSSLHNNFLAQYMGQQGLPDRTQTARRLKQPEVKLRWGEVFNLFLRDTAKQHTGYRKWVSHFNNWLTRPVLDKLHADDLAFAQTKARKYLN